MTAIILSITLGTLSATDRPDMTESTETAMPKAIQLETDMISLQFSSSKSMVNIGNMLLKTGLFKSADIHFGWSGITENSFVARIRKSFSISEANKVALIPYVVFTTQETSGFGLAIPFSWNVFNSLSVASMYNIEVSREKEVFHFNTLSFGFALTPKIGSFLEVAIRWTGLNSTYKDLFINSGLTWTMRKWVQFDAGTYFNVLNKEFTIFIGMSVNISLSS